jgi:hypothetical protein
LFQTYWRRILVIYVACKGGRSSFGRAKVVLDLDLIVEGRSKHAANDNDDKNNKRTFRVSLRRPRNDLVRRDTEVVEETSSQVNFTDPLSKEGTTYAITKVREKKYMIKNDLCPVFLNRE